MATEPLPERRTRVKEMELRINAILAAATSLSDYQTSLYEIIENVLVEELGYSLGRWEYDCEIEYWGGMSYMDGTIPDEMILRSEYPEGVRLHWGELPCENGEQADD